MSLKYEPASAPQAHALHGNCIKARKLHQGALSLLLIFFFFITLKPRIE